MARLLLASEQVTPSLFIFQVDAKDLVFEEATDHFKFAPFVDEKALAPLI